MIYLLDSTKVPFRLSHAHHAHVLLFLPYTVLSQSVLLGLRFIHSFSLRPTLCSDWNLCLAIRYVYYIFSTTRTYCKQTIILFLYNSRDRKALLFSMHDLHVGGNNRWVPLLLVYSEGNSKWLHI